MFIKKVVNHFPTSFCHLGYALCGFEKENYTKTFSLTTLVVVESILPTYTTTFFVREREAKGYFEANMCEDAKIQCIGKKYYF